MANRDDYIIQRIIQYGAEITKAHQFFHDDQQLFIDQDNGAIYRNAVTMPLLQIGELSKLLSNEFITLHDDIPWKNIIRLRDFLAHHYMKLDYHEIWNTAHQDMDRLIAKLHALSESTNA